MIEIRKSDMEEFKSFLSQEFDKDSAKEKIERFKDFELNGYKFLAGIVDLNLVAICAIKNSKDKEVIISKDAERLSIETFF